MTGVMSTTAHILSLRDAVRLWRAHNATESTIRLDVGGGMSKNKVLFTYGFPSHEQQVLKTKEEAKRTACERWGSSLEAAAHVEYLDLMTWILASERQGEKGQVWEITQGLCHALSPVKWLPARSHRYIDSKCLNFVTQIYTHVCKCLISIIIQSIQN